jgi:putative hydrolase of the HAD superfamily
LTGLNEVPRALVAGVDLLCLDAGNTVIFLDHDRLARLARQAVRAGGGMRELAISPELLIRTEGEAKRLAELAELHDAEWSFRDRPGARTWGKMVGTMLVRAGVEASALPAVLDVVWRDHERKNLWWKVPAGLGEALDAIRALGVKVAIISNSEGMLERLFQELGVREHLDLVVDSGLVGVEKPDPGIFQIAFEHFGVPADRALHLGDVFATDILGARRAHTRYALVDPFGHYEGRHLDVPRVPGAVEVARGIEAARS